jgi:hypothetical protein
MTARVMKTTFLVERARGAAGATVSVMFCMAMELDDFAVIVFILPFIRHLHVAWQIVRLRPW